MTLIRLAFCTYQHLRKCMQVCSQPYSTSAAVDSWQRTATAQENAPYASLHSGTSPATKVFKLTEMAALGSTITPPALSKQHIETCCP